jgi:multiple sugar transport system ATP-binding protein
MATLSLRHVHKSYDGVPIIQDLNLEVADREFIVVVGPSGCGKSTLIRMIAGLEELGSGDLLIDGERMNDVAPPSRGVAMVFQTYALYPHMTVRQNMSFALRLARVSPVERERKVAEAARILDLEKFLDRKPGQLSGGQRQRVAIGRAIVRNPKVFLLDEPLSNLDAALRGQMRTELARLHGTLDATMIYVTHDQVEAMTMADRIVVLQAGRIEQVGTPLEIYQRPNNLFVAGFMGSPRMNLLPARIAQVVPGAMVVELNGAIPLKLDVEPGVLCPGDEVTIGIRPEGLCADPSGVLAGIARVVERLGSQSLVHIDLDQGARVIAQMSGRIGIANAERIQLSIDGGCCHVFDTSGRALIRRGHMSHAPAPARRS